MKQQPTVNTPRPFTPIFNWKAIHRLSILCTIPLSLIVALRGNTGDTRNYLDTLNYTQSFPWNPIKYYSEMGMEWLFGLLSWLINTLSLPPQVVFFIYSLATFYFLSIAASKIGLSLLSIAPYYLGTFFLTQQFLQIRQGLAMALVFSILTKIVARRKSLSPLLYLTISSLVHIASSLSLLMIWALSFANPHQRSRRDVALWCLILSFLTFIIARSVTNLDIFILLDRLTIYQSDSQYNTTRDIFAPANIRALILMVLMLAAASERIIESRVFLVLLGLYAIHIGIRFGFYDFLILSGRLSTVLSFAEVFILPLLVNERVQIRWLRGVIAITYLLAHAYTTYQIQVSTLIDDYFTPL